MNPLLSNIVRVVVLSLFSGVMSDILGFRLRVSDPQQGAFLNLKNNILEIIHLVRTQNFPKNYVSGGKKCYFFGKFCVRIKWMISYDSWPNYLRQISQTCTHLEKQFEKLFFNPCLLKEHWFLVG